MTDELAERLARLDPRQRALLSRRLAELQGRFERVDSPIPRLPVNGAGASIFALSAAQERFWFLEQLETGEASRYHDQLMFEVQGVLNRETLERSLTEIARRHQILGGRFESQAGVPVVILDTATPPFPVREVDLTAIPDAARERAWRQAAEQDLRQRFDLRAGPPRRATLFVLDHDRGVLVLTLHHLLTDGWSVSILLRELAELYRAFRQGQPAPLPELPLQYHDYAAWQRANATDSRWETGLSFWERHLARAPEQLQLPTDRPRPPVLSPYGASERFDLDPEWVRRLRELATSAGTTLSTVLCCGFAALLYRYSGQEDFVVGAPVANRLHPDLQNLIGPFINTLALRFDLSGSPTFRELLAHFSGTFRVAYEHQDVPFELVVERTRPERRAGQQPLFQVMFAMRDIAADALEVPGATLRVVTGDAAAAKLDIALLISQTPSAMWGTLEYSRDLFDAATMRRMAGHYCQLLGEAVRQPDGLIAALPYLPEQERAMIAEWSVGPTPRRPSGNRLHQVFERRAAATPDRLALVTSEEEISCRMLNQRANHMACALIDAGVRPGEWVALCLESASQMVAAILAVWKAGAAYLPLDPSHPRERLAAMIEDAQVRYVMVAGQASAPRLAGCRAEIVLLEPGETNLQAAENPAIDVGPDQFAYLIYTSGSTGRPKGVPVRHRQLETLVEAQDEVLDIGPEDRMLQFASFTFDASIIELGVAFGSGAVLCIPEGDERIAGSPLVSFMREKAVTAAFLTPSVLAQLDPASLPRVRTLACGGEALPLDLAMAWAAQRRFFNLYGLTETTVWVCWSRITERATRVPIGRPRGGVAVHVVDERFQPVPVGVPGQLCVSGQCLAPYLNRAQLTAERFLDPSPIPQLDPPVLLTGDLVRWAPDGVLEWLGRTDRQIKIRGVRIEPGEIECAIRAFAGIKEAVVVAEADEAGRQHLVAYVVGAQPDNDELRRHLLTQLPEYLVPRRYIPLERVPLTSSGKVDRAALPKSTGLSGRESRLSRPAQTQLERLIAAAWCEVLNLPDVRAHDNFFDVGGHSLLLGRLQQVLEMKLDRPMRIVDFFAYPTVASMARFLTGTSTGKDESGEQQELAAGMRRRVTHLRSRSESIRKEI